MKSGIGYVMCFLLGGVAMMFIIKSAGMVASIGGQDLVCYPLHNPFF